MKILLMITPEEAQSHFLQRLEERYGITGISYEHILQLPRRGILSKNRSNSIGYLTINGIKVYYLFSRRLQLYTTCYPAEIETNISSCIEACFSKACRPLAHHLYKIIQIELDNCPKEFANVKDAAIYYFSHLQFPNLATDQYIHGSISLFKICHIIKRIINIDYPYCHISIEKSQFQNTYYDAAGYPMETNEPEP